LETSTTANRFETYAIAAPAGSKSICLNGATAYLGKPGDLVTIMSFAVVDEREAATGTRKSSFWPTPTAASSSRRVAEHSRRVTSQYTQPRLPSGPAHLPFFS